MAILLETDRLIVSEVAGPDRVKLIDVTARAGAGVLLGRADVEALAPLFRSYLSETRPCGHGANLDCQCASRGRL